MSKYLMVNQFMSVLALAIGAWLVYEKYPEWAWVPMLWAFLIGQKSGGKFSSSDEKPKD